MSYVSTDKILQNYVPEVDHYVRWNGQGLEGWIYFVDKEYLTLEIMVRKKSEESFNDAMFHRNERCLVLVYPKDWKDLVFVKKR